VLSGIGAATKAQTLLDNDFATVSQFEAYTVVDANEDFQTWGYDDIFMAASCSRDYDADDWLITPQVQLDAAKTYLLTYEVQIDMEGEEQLSILLGNRAAVSAMSTTLLQPTGITSVDSETKTLIFTVGASGSYNIGFHYSTKGDPYSNRLNLKRVRLEETVSQGVPASVTDFTVTPAANAQLEATVSLRTPDTTIGGAALAELTKVDLYRGSVLIHTFDNPGIGQVVSFKDELPASGSYTYRAVPANSFGEGEAATKSVYVGSDVPGPVTNLRFVYNHETHKTTLTWDAPTVGANGGHVDAAGLTYNVRRFRASNLVAQGLTNNSFEEEVDIDFLLAAEKATREQYADLGLPLSVEYVIDGQGLMQYYVRAVSAAGQGTETVSNNVIIGEANTLPYAESFAEGKRTHFWRTDISNTRARWTAMADTRYTQDGDGGMLSFNSVENEHTVAMAHTGNISMKDAQTPMLSFYYYYGYAMADPLVIKVAKDDGDFETLTTIPLSDESQRGRYLRASVPLTGCAGHNIVRVGFELTSTTSVDLVYLDNISIIDQRQNDLALQSVLLPRNLKVGETRYVTAEVRNVGSADVTMGQYAVNVYVNDVLAGSAVGMPIAAGASQSVMVPVQASLNMQSAQGGTGYELQGVLYAEVVYAADEVADNNRTADKVLTVKMPRHPTATDLKATSTAGQGVTLTWSAPAAPRTEDGQVTDGFEEYDDFVITNFGDWTLYDLDKQLTWTVGEQWRYANAGMPQAGMIWNTTQVENNTSHGLGLNSKTWQPRTGEKCLASFGVSLDNCDDWMVSPELSGNAQMVSFYARNVADSQKSYTEQFQLYFSTTGVESTNFMALDQSPRSTTSEWEKFEYMLPAGAKYFALRKVTPADNSWAMLIDDVTFAPDTLAAQTGLMHFGYYVYRNGERINTSLVPTPVFTDADGKPGDVYRVTAVYNQGESVYSNEAVATESDGIVEVSTAAAASRQLRYDLGGRQLRQSAKGIVVEKGKKVLSSGK